MDSILWSYATHSPNYWRDTTDSLRKVKSLNNLSRNILLAICEMLKFFTQTHTPPTNKEIKNRPFHSRWSYSTSTYHFLFSDIYLSFRENICLQINSIIIVTHRVPQYAAVFMPEQWFPVPVTQSLFSTWDTLSRTLSSGHINRNILKSSVRTSVNSDSPLTSTNPIVRVTFFILCHYKMETIQNFYWKHIDCYICLHTFRIYHKINCQ